MPRQDIVEMKMGRSDRLDFLRRHLRRTDLVLAGVCIFALSVSAIGYLVAGEEAIKFPVLSVKRWPVIMLPFSAWLALVVGIMIRRNYERPIKIIWRYLRRDPLWPIRSIALLSVFTATAPAYSVLKSQIPRSIPFYLDPVITQWEQGLFGQDPWRITHSVFGLYGTVFLDRIYLLWFPISAFILIWATMTRDRVFQAQATATLAFVWFGLGIGLATLLSSCGPLYYYRFYGDEHFQPLIATLLRYHSEINIKAVVIGEMLVSTKMEGKFGEGISAAPSLHVGMTFLTWQMVQARLGWRSFTTWILMVYVVLIWIASIHLAWHYWLDGAISIGVVALFWKVTSLLSVRFAAPRAGQHEFETVLSPSGNRSASSPLPFREGDAGVASIKGSMS